MPLDTPTEPVETPLPEGKEDIIEFLAEEDEPKTDEEDLLKDEKAKGDKDKTDKEDGEEEEESEESEESEEDDELEDILKEDEEPTDEELELVTPVRRREILAKYPKLFKEFPYLERAYYREQKFTEIYPTLEDARSAQEKAQTFDNLEQDVLSGNSEKIMLSIKEDNVNSFYKFADAFLPTLYKVDQDAFRIVTGNVIKQAIMSMANEARAQSNDTLMGAAQILNQFAFGSSNFVPPQKLAKEETKNPEEDKIKEREQQFNRRQFENAQNTVIQKVESRIRSTIEHHIDPKKSMSDYIRKNAVRDAVADLNKLIGEDRRFRVINKTLWERAMQNDFDDDSLSRVQSALLSKAKTLLPTVIKKARNEALKGIGKRTPSENTDRKGPAKGRSVTPQADKGKLKTVPKGMSAIDFLNSED